MTNTTKRIDYDALINKLVHETWYTGQELQTVWKIDHKTRKMRIKTLVDQGRLLRKGKTSDVKYRLREAGTKAIKPTGNGVIDAKLRREAGLPEKPTTLEGLITAATNIGTENEVMKKALLSAKATIEKALETVT